MFRKVNANIKTISKDEVIKNSNFCVRCGKILAKDKKVCPDCDKSNCPCK